MVFLLGGLGVERGPDEASELAGDSGDDLGSRLALGERAVEATVKPALPANIGETLYPPGI